MMCCNWRTCSSEIFRTESHPEPRAQSQESVADLPLDTYLRSLERSLQPSWPSVRFSAEQLRSSIVTESEGREEVQRLRAWEDIRTHHVSLWTVEQKLGLAGICWACFSLSRWMIALSPAPRVSSHHMLAFIIALLCEHVRMMRTPSINSKAVSHPRKSVA